MSVLEDQTIALAGIFQAAQLVDHIAQKGECSQSAFDASFNSLFKIEAESTREIFSELERLETGLSALVDYLGGENRGSAKQVSYYVLSMMKLSSQLLSDQTVAEKIQRGLVDIQVSAREFELGRDAVLARLDGLYQDRVSHLRPRVMVQGDQTHLQNSVNAARVRTLLLAGIRAAVLWHQLGGSKWKLVMSRRKYVDRARCFLD
ncbi:MAG: high frequency lysogenization protein HflD [Pseudomonadota bacterium]